MDLVWELNRDSFYETQIGAPGSCTTSHLGIESFPDQKLASGHHGDSWTNKPAKHDDRVSPLSPH